MNIEALGDKIKRLRKAKRWSQEDLAGASGVGRRVIQELELGRGNPTVDTLEALARSLETSLVELIQSGAKGVSQAIPDVSAGRDVLSSFLDAPPDIQKLVLAVLYKDATILQSASPRFQQFAKDFLKAAISR
jgi:transcriptional regulator with XRE-family HTH domain